MLDRVDLTGTTKYKNYKSQEVGSQDDMNGSIFDDMKQFVCTNLFENNFKDGKIGNTKQQKLNDCWILSDINSLSYTQAGKKIIEDALDYQKEGVVVHMKAAGDYLISYSDVNKAAKSGKYSKGDKDMIVFELAMERVLNDVKEGNIEVAQDAPFYIETGKTIQETRGDKSTIDGGRTSEAIYYLTGKESEIYFDKEEMLNILNEIENNSKDLAICCCTPEDKRIFSDIEGNFFTVEKNHACSVKEVKDGTVTIVNPWDSSKEEKLSYDEFVKSFYGLHITDLSDNNPS